MKTPPSASASPETPSAVMAALNDKRKVWPGKPGTANGPRFASAVAARFAAGESIASLVADYNIPAADVVCAIRYELQSLDLLSVRIGAAVNRYDEPRRFGAEEAPR